ncbi:MAG: chemotaxis protein CheA [Terriglobales bacterium]
MSFSTATSMDEITKEFLIECNELLDQLDRDLVELEKDPKSKDLLARIFRAIHTIKGTSGTLGFPKLESVSHVGENLLSRMRDGKLLLNAEITSALLTMIDAIRKILRTIEASGTEGEPELAEIIHKLTSLLDGGEASKGEKQVADLTKGEPGEAQNLGEILIEKHGTSASAVEAAAQQQVDGDPRRIGEILVHKGAAEPKAVLEALQEQGTQAASAAAGSTIRVDVNLLDKVMNLVGELVLARNQILQFTTTQQDAVFLSTAQRLNLITTELQEGVMKTRMQPIGNVWNKFPRIIRDLSVSCGKQVELEMEGTDTELDKTIIEAIKDPLTHIVRNSLDHGIETPAVRASRGKPPAGRLRLRAFHEGGQVNIEISDDGAGIDLPKVKEKAIQKGVISAQQSAQLSDREVMNLVFLPGFSTAEQVSNVSGRGVGMDVVKTNIEKIGGTVDLASVLGQGTTLRIKIPLTLAIIPALVVTSGHERFAIPQVSLLELVRLEGAEAAKGIEMIHGAPVHRLRGNLLPLVYLNQQLRLEGETSSIGTVNIVVLQADGRPFGLVVDVINDTEEIVVKPLGKQLKGIACFAGATIMGDGQVALILDVLGLAQQADVISEGKERSISEAKAKADDTALGQHSWLVFRVGEKGRVAIPLSLVSRLEEFEPSAIEISGNQPVIQYRGEIMPLVRVSEALQLSSARRQEDRMQVVVYSEEGRSVGLVVEEILDIAEQQVAITKGRQSARLLGSAVIQQHVTDLLNVPEIVASVLRKGQDLPASAEA